MWLFVAEVAEEEAVWILVIPCMSGGHGGVGVTRGVSPGGTAASAAAWQTARPGRSCTDIGMTRPMKEGPVKPTSPSHRAVSPPLSSFVLCVVSTHQHFKWWEACGNGKAEHAYWVNEARSEAFALLPLSVKKRRSIRGFEWVEWDRAGIEGETSGTTSRTHRLRLSRTQLQQEKKTKKKPSG